LQQDYKTIYDITCPRAKQKRLYGGDQEPEARVSPSKWNTLIANSVENTGSTNQKSLSSLSKEKTPSYRTSFHQTRFHELWARKHAHF
jgi:hypothetical protein